MTPAIDHGIWLEIGHAHPAENKWIPNMTEDSQQALLKDAFADLQAEIEQLRAELSQVRGDDRAHCPVKSSLDSNKVIECLEDIIRACGCSMNWMEQVDRATMSGATRGILHVDMGMCSTAILKAKRLVQDIKNHD